jgi:hypothetical protein
VASQEQVVRSGRRVWPGVNTAPYPRGQPQKVRQTQQEGGLGSERGLATPSPDAKGREPSTLSMSIMPREP